MSKIKILEDFIDYTNKDKIDSYIKKASKLECNELNSENIMHKTLHKIKNNLFSKKIKNKIHIFQSIIKVDKFFKYTPNEKDESYFDNIFNDLDCGIYRIINNDYKYHFEYLISNIFNSMKTYKILFIILDFEDFGLDYYNDYEAHSTVLLFLPEKDKLYNCYYINSHGIELLNDKFYEYKLSSKLKKPFDITFVEMLIHHLNKNSKYKINYCGKNNYTGANFQISDTRGICFVFPIVIFYYFCKYYFNDRIFKTKWGYIKINNGKKLIKNGYLNLFIESMFLDFCEEYKMLLLKDIKNPSILRSNNLMLIIENKKLLYCKIILRALVKFISQFNN